MANPLLLAQIARLKEQGARTPGLTGPQLADLLRLRRKGERAEQGSEAARERLKALATEARGVSGEIAGEYANVPSYKLPERGGPSKGQVNLGLLLGGLGALFDVENPETLTGAAIGGAKAMADEEFQDKMAALRERQAADERARASRVAGLQAKLSGIGTEMDVAGSEQATLMGEAGRIGSELFQREEAAKAAGREAERNRQWWTSFNWTKEQAKQAQDNWQKEFDLRSETLADKLARDEAGFVSKGIDPKTARLWAYGSVMANAAQAEMANEELARKKAVFALISPEREAQQELWRMDFEKTQGEKQMKLLDAQIASANRSNRPDMGPTLQEQKLGLAVGNVDRTQALIDAAEQELTSNAAKYGNPEYVNDASKVRAAIRGYKNDMLNYMRQANAIRPGLYDTSLLENELGSKVRNSLFPSGR